MPKRDGEHTRAYPSTWGSLGKSSFRKGARYYKARMNRYVFCIMKRRTKDPVYDLLLVKEIRRDISVVPPFSLMTSALLTFIVVVGEVVVKDSKFMVVWHFGVDRIFDTYENNFTIY